MKVVECPKCALRFEPEAVTESVFCPQCGESFRPAGETATTGAVAAQARVVAAQAS